MAGRRPLYDDLSEEEKKRREEFPDSDSRKFRCPNCGEISQDDVVFLCNNCNNKDLIFTKGVFLCPSCMTKGENFQCMKCDSKDVVMKVVD